MLNTRKILHVDWPLELQLMSKLKDNLLAYNMNASNTVVVAVSTDYSSIVAQYLRHQLSHDGEICVGFGIDVPYPDQEFDNEFINDIYVLFNKNLKVMKDKKILLVEAGVIRGGNYTTVCDLIRNHLKFSQEIVTLTLFENYGSKFKSDFVGQYYDDLKEDLTFWWERPNIHWLP